MKNKDKINRVWKHTIQIFNEINTLLGFINITHDK